MGEKSSEDSQSTYIIRPPFKDKFNSASVREMLKLLLMEHFSGKKYQAINPSEYGQTFTDVILTKLKDVPCKGYKYVVQVVIAQQKGQGMWMNARSFWDSDTDSVATEFFNSEEMIVSASVYASYYY